MTTPSTTMIRPLDTQDVYDVPNEVVFHLDNAGTPDPMSLRRDVPMLADIIRIVLGEHGAVVSDHPMPAVVD